MSVITNMSSGEKAMANDNQNDNKTNTQRRDFLKAGGVGLLGALIGTRVVFNSVEALAQGGGKLEMLKPTDPQAQALGYYEDAKKVDTKKWTKRAGPEGAKQYCHNCQFYTVASGDPAKTKSAPCTIFANKGVTAQGWCNTWTPRPPKA